MACFLHVFCTVKLIDFLALMIAAFVFLQIDFLSLSHLPIAVGNDFVKYMVEVCFHLLTALAYISNICVALESFEFLAAK